MMEAYELEHIKKIRAISPECMVLLKSDGSFPLETPGKIAIYGNAARKTITVRIIFFIQSPLNKLQIRLPLPCCCKTDTKAMHRVCSQGYRHH